MQHQKFTGLYHWLEKQNGSYLLWEIWRDSEGQFIGGDNCIATGTLEEIQASHPEELLEAFEWEEGRQYNV